MSVADRGEGGQGRALTRNLRLHVLEGALYMAGVEFASLSVIISVLLKRLGASDTIIGVSGSLVFAGMALQVLAVPAIEGRQGRKRFLLGTGVAMRVPFVLMAAAVYSLASSAPALCLRLVLACLFTNSVILGLTIPAWMDLIARTIAPDRRAWLMGYRHAFSGVLIMGVGLASRAILGMYGFPNGYVVLLSFAFALTSVSWVVFLRVQDVPQDGPVRAIPLREYLRGTVRLLRRDEITRRLIVSRSWLQAARAGELFFAVSAVTRLHLQDSAAGTFMLVHATTRSLAALAFAYVGDRVGHRRMMTLGSAASTAACVLAVFAGSVPAYLGVFAIVGALFGIVQTANAPLSMSLAPEGQRVGFYSLLLLAQVPVALLSQVGGGALADGLGYPWLFGVCASFGVMATLTNMRLPDARPPRGTP